MFGHGERVTWHRWTPGTGTDRYGAPLPGEFKAIDLDGVGFAPEATAEDTPERRVRSSAKLYPPEPLPYSARDQFTVRGVRYGVIGDSQGGWVNPFTSRIAGQEIELVRVTGGGRNG